MSFAVKDEDIIKKADNLIEGQGDGRISKEDMRELLKIDLDTPEKMETMLHILTTYNVTSTAKDEFVKKLSVIWSSMRKVCSLVEMNKED